MSLIEGRHYSKKILIALIILKFGAGAMMSSTANFIAPVTKDFGCLVSEFTLMISIMAISMSLLYTVAARFLNKYRIGIVIGIACICEGLGLALLATYNSIYWFYLSGVIIGAAQAFTGLVATPIIVNMWFKKKTGTVLGIVIAVQQTSTILFGIISGQLITSLGWRMTYVVIAAVVTATAPFMFALMKSPKEAGCEPYGMEEMSTVEDRPIPTDQLWGLTLKEAFKKAAFWITLLTCLMYSYGTGGFGHFASYSTLELNESVNFGALAGVCMSLGGVLCSVLLGRINDRFGVKAGLVWGAVWCTLGFSVAMLAKYSSHYLVFLGAFIAGLAYSMYTVQCPLIVRSVVGDKHYAHIWAVMMIANSSIGGGLAFTIGLFYDKTGTYAGAFVTCIGMFIMALVTGVIAENMAAKYKHKFNVS
jgi:OFA family oxalate/formate antiporter-like MFS transporter